MNFEIVIFKLISYITILERLPRITFFHPASWGSSTMVPR